MKDGFVKVSACSPKLHLANCQENAKEIITLIKQCNKINSKVIVFPELCITGYSCGDLFLQHSLLDNALKALKTIVESTKNADAIIVVSLPLEINNKLYICAAVINKGIILGLIPKTFIPNYTEFYELRHFTSSKQADFNQITLFENIIPFGIDLIFSCENILDLKIAVEICEDLWVPNSPSINYCLAGANIICNPSASNETLGKAKYREDLVKIQSAKLICAYLYSSSGYGESSTDLVYSGQKLIAENGVIQSNNNPIIEKQTEILHSDIDLQLLNYERRRINCFIPEENSKFRYIGFFLNKIDYIIKRKFSKSPFVPSIKEDIESRCNEITSLQSLGLKRRIEHINPKKLIIGISGGLDSTLALLVLKRAVDELKRPSSDIIAITMPCFGTSERTYNNAKKLIKCIGAEFREINISNDVNNHFKTIKHSGKHDIAYENAQARERMQVLMDIANMDDGIVIGTPDLSEIALGFSTYNGDHMSSYAVNCGVPKTLIRYLILYFAHKSEQHLKEVLLSIIDTPVSPELLPTNNGEIAQKTEEIIGEYILHDFILFYFIRYGFSKNKILRLLKIAFTNEYDEIVLKNTLDIFYSRFFANQFKRSCMPDGPKIGSVSLSPRGDFRMPSDCKNYE